MYAFWASPNNKTPTNPRDWVFRRFIIGVHKFKNLWTDTKKCDIFSILFSIFQSVYLLFKKGAVQMDWQSYSARLERDRYSRLISSLSGTVTLEYIKELLDQQLPVIYNQETLAFRLNIPLGYLKKISFDTKAHYETYYIKKRNGKLRRIDEPSLVLKNIQSWILNNILYKIPCSRFAKAYVPGTDLKSNSRFHKKQNTVLTIDIKDFFPSISIYRVIEFFFSCGYTFTVAVTLANLCCLNGSLPQGAPTSPYLSNLIMREFDGAVSEYCIDKKIRYTRYADDMTFSGDFDIASLLFLVDRQLYKLKLKRNPQKTKVMRSGDRQYVTGVVVNEFQQVPREYRMKIRQEIHYIKKFGLEEHLLYINDTKPNYLDRLSGRIAYVLSINPQDEQMLKYQDYVKTLNKKYN